MLGECSSSTIALSCSVTLRGFTASVDSPMIAILKVLKCDESQRTRDIRIDPKTTSYPLNESFDFALDTGFDERTGMLCEEKVAVSSLIDQNRSDLESRAEQKRADQLCRV